MTVMTVMTVVTVATVVTVMTVVTVVTVATVVTVVTVMTVDSGDSGDSGDSVFPTLLNHHEQKTNNKQACHCQASSQHHRVSAGMKNLPTSPSLSHSPHHMHTWVKRVYGRV
jgi:hypothetical protein